MLNIVVFYLVSFLFFYIRLCVRSAGLSRKVGYLHFTGTGSSTPSLRSIILEVWIRLSRAGSGKEGSTSRSGLSHSLIILLARTLTFSFWPWSSQAGQVARFTPFNQCFREDSYSQILVNSFLKVLSFSHLERKVSPYVRLETRKKGPGLDREREGSKISPRKRHCLQPVFLRKEKTFL